jgi:hypothetical protein
MQLSSSASAPKVMPVRSQQPFSAQALLPPEVQNARVGHGTVASEIDRSIRFRLDGDGPASEAKLVPDSAAAAELAANPAAMTRLSGALKTFLHEADGYQGKENLNSITLLPDEHASKGISVLNWQTVEGAGPLGLDAAVTPPRSLVDKVHKDHPEYTRDEVVTGLRRMAAADVTKKLTKDEAANIKFAAAWNAEGNIVFMPDESRNLLASLGLYRIKPGDEATKLPPKYRPYEGYEAWHAGLHETHHSITPELNERAPEHTQVFEEAVPEVLTVPRTLGKMFEGGGMPSLLAAPARAQKGLAVDWSAWNRDHLPQAPQDQVATAEGRYVDGPELVKGLLKLAKIDRRTTEGKARTEDLLQGERAARVPKRLADAIVEAHGLPAAKAEPLAELIRKVSVGAKDLREIKDFVGA